MIALFLKDTLESVLKNMYILYLKQPVSSTCKFTFLNRVLEKSKWSRQNECLYTSSGKRTCFLKSWILVWVTDCLLPSDACFNFTTSFWGNSLQSDHYIYSVHVHILIASSCQGNLTQHHDWPMLGLSSVDNQHILSIYFHE